MVDGVEVEVEDVVGFVALRQPRSREANESGIGLACWVTMGGQVAPLNAAPASRSATGTTILWHGS